MNPSAAPGPAWAASLSGGAALICYIQGLMKEVRVNPRGVESFRGWVDVMVSEVILSPPQTPPAYSHPVHRLPPTTETQTQSSGFIIILTIHICGYIIYILYMIT